MGIHIKKDKKKVTEGQFTEVFGIVGSGKGVGVTHFSVLLANYLTGVLKKRTAVLEWNENGDFKRMEDILCKKSVSNRSSQTFSLLEVSYVKKAGRKELSECIDQGIDCIVIDFGSDFYGVREEFFCCSRKVLIGSFCEWQLGSFIELLIREKHWKGRWNILAVFGSEATEAEVKKRLHISAMRIPESKDAFSVTGKTMDFLNGFLKY